MSETVSRSIRTQRADSVGKVTVAGHISDGNGIGELLSLRVDALGLVKNQIFGADLDQHIPAGRNVLVVNKGTEVSCERAVFGFDLTGLIIVPSKLPRFGRVEAHLRKVFPVEVSIG